MKIALRYFVFMNPAIEQHYNEVLLSSDKNRIDVRAVHHFLSTESYWARHIPLNTVVRSIEHALCLGLYNQAGQMGFGRMITDQATFGYLADVYVLKAYRGQGWGKVLMAGFNQWADDFGLRRFLLTTQDAHSFYEQCGFQKFPYPERFMHRPGYSP